MNEAWMLDSLAPTCDASELWGKVPNLLPLFDGL
jgi:hypothetical protein